MQIGEQYAGRWPGILRALGVEEGSLTGKHCACPLCGGKDRFRFDNKEGRGTYYCSGCGPGDGPSLLRKLYGWDFATMVRKIKEVEHEVTDQPFQPKVDIDRRRRDLNELWQAAKDDIPMRKYLHSRGLPIYAANGARSVRGCPDLWDVDDRCYYGGMVSLIQKLDGTPVSIHRIWVNKEGKRIKKIMPPVENITGAAVRFGNPVAGETLHVAEGIESALAVRCMVGREKAVWATISAHGMERLEVPKDVGKVVIWADNDESYTGQAAAYALAHRLKVKEGKLVWVEMPMATGMDPLDMYLARTPKVVSHGQAS